MTAGPHHPGGSVRWAACGAAVAGQEHQRRGQGCDDAYGYGIADDFVVAAVADGAGSVTGTSAWGAYRACQSVLDNALKQSFLDDYRGCAPELAERMLRWLFDQALHDVVRQAETLNLHPVQLSTTLCVALIDGCTAVFGQVGDGVIAAESGGHIESLLVEHKTEYANTTTFLQSGRTLAEAVRTAVRGDVTAFALSTDGMAYKITDVATGRAFEPFFRDSWQHVRAGARADKFAALLRGITDDQTGDDKTMVLAASRAAAPDDAGLSPTIAVDSSPPPRQPDIVATDLRETGADRGLSDTSNVPEVNRHPTVPARERRRRIGLRSRRHR